MNYDEKNNFMTNIINIVCSPNIEIKSISEYKINTVY